MNNLQIACWNVDGWSGPNRHAKENVIYRLEAGVLLLVETWAKSQREVDIDGYTCFNKCRMHINKDACRNSGGVSILIRNDLLSIYDVKPEFCAHEEIIIVNLIDKISEFKIRLYGVYLPPENSVYGQNMDQSYEYLLSDIYENTESDLLVVMGDMNGCVGSKTDCIEVIDCLPVRTNIDTVANDHGEALLQFCLQANLAICNGRITPLCDNYTSISHHGKAVVDYILLPHDHFSYVTKFAVHTMSELVEKYKIHNLEKGRLSDHSVLCMHVQLSSGEGEDDSKGDPYYNNDSMNVRNVNIKKVDSTSNSGSPDKLYSEPPKRYKKTTLPPNFMESEERLLQCAELIDASLERNFNQERVDTVYSAFVEMYHAEMSIFMKEINRTKNSKKAIRHTRKPYWDEELSTTWNGFHKAEKLSYVWPEQTGHLHL